MTTSRLTPALDPETVEELQLRARIERLRDDLAAAVAELDELRTMLAAFEARYDARIGTLMVEVDRLGLENAILRRRTGTLKESIDAWRELEASIEREFAAERERVEREAEEAMGASRRAEQLPPPPAPEVAEAIRTQYRKLARRYHPDLAVEDGEREQRQDVMRRINVAMEMNDLGTLLDIDRELPGAVSDIPGPTRGARIAWSTAEIARLESSLAQRSGDLAALRTTSLHQLWQRVEHEPVLLHRLESDLRTELTTAQMEYHALTRQYEDLVRQATAGAV